MLCDLRIKAEYGLSATAGLLFYIFSQSAFALDLWVDRDSLGGACNDDRTAAEVTRETPWCTLGMAGMTAGAGDTVTVRGGVYSEPQICDGCRGTAVLEVLNNGAEDGWIRFLEQPGERVVLDGDNGPPAGVLLERSDSSPLAAADPVAVFVEIDGFEVRRFGSQDGVAFGNCVMIDNVSDVALRRLDIHGCTYNAVEIQKTDRVILEYSRVHDNPLAGWTSAVDLYECGVGNVIRGNFIWNNSDEGLENSESEGHGIIVDICGTESTALIENNVVWNNQGWCVKVLKSNGVTVRNNTCWHNGLQRPDRTGEVEVLGDDSVVYNNVLQPQDGRIALYMRDPFPLPPQNPDDDDYPVDLNTSRVDGNLIWAPDNDLAFAFDSNRFLSVADYRDDFTDYPWGAGVIEAEPLFIDPLGGNFRVPVGSALIDTAIEPQVAALDIEQRPRPVDGDGDGFERSDRGAYEIDPTPDDEPPEAFLFADTVAGSAPLRVNFSAGDSTDNVGVVTFSFDFGDGEQNPNAPANVQHVFTEDGSYTVELTVFDAAGLSDVTTLVVDVATDPGDTEPPVANLLANPVTGNLPLTVNFNASASSDNLGITEYAYAFGDFDGTTSAGAEPTASFTYTEEGEFEAEVVVSDAAGNSAVAKVTISVTMQSVDNQPPSASLLADPLTGAAPLTVNFDASASTDDVAVASYGFDFDGTGASPSVSATGSFTYTEPGQYTATVNVFDTAGNSDLAAVTINVTSGDSETPVSIFTAVPASGPAPLTVTFDGSASTDDLGITIYRFDFGDFSGTYSPEAVVQHTYAAPGTYQVALKVFDADGNTDFSKMSVTVTEAGVADTEPPVARLSADSIGGAVPLTVSFDAGASTDNVGIVDYRFDFGDGASGGGAQDTASHTYDQAGTYTAEMTATDAAGNTATAAVSITVSGDTGGEQELTLQQGREGYLGASDTFLFSAIPRANFGSSIELKERIGLYAMLFKYAIFESEGGPVPDGAIVESATLSLFKSSPYRQEYRAQRVAVSWSEGAATWLNRTADAQWAEPGAGAEGLDIVGVESATTQAGFAAGQWVDLDVTAGVKAFAAGADNQGWRVVAVSGDRWRIKRFHSSDYDGDALLRPKLSVVYRIPGT